LDILLVQIIESNFEFNNHIAGVHIHLFNCSKISTF